MGNHQSIDKEDSSSEMVKMRLPGMIWIQLSAVTVIILCLFFWIWFLRDVRTLRKRTHIHFWMILCYFCYNQLGIFVATSAITLSSFLEKTPSFYSVDIGARFLGSIFVSGGICVHLALICERLCATVYRRTYEKHRHPYLVFLIILCMAAYSILYSSSWTFFKIDPESIMRPILYASYAVTLVMLVVLTYVNKKLSRINLNSTIVLSQRYQIYENIRMIKFITPLLVFGIGGLISCYVLSQVVFSNLEAMQARLFYYMVYSCFVMSGIIFVLATQPKRAAKVGFYCTKYTKPANAGNRVSDIGRLRINAKGQIVQKKAEVFGGKKHFDFLKDAWK